MEPIFLPLGVQLELAICVNISDIKPLSDAIDVETAIYVPKEVVDNTAAPLFAKIAVPDSKGGHYGTEIFTYKIR